MPRYIDADEAIRISKEDKLAWVYDLTDLEEFLAGVPSVDVAPKSEWISVDERLPESRKFVIVCDEYGNVGEAYFYKQDRKFEWVDDEEIAFATHWMPLPEPPKKGGK